MEPVLGGGPGETGSSGQGGHVMEQANSASLGTLGGIWGFTQGLSTYWQAKERKR